MTVANFRTDLEALINRHNREARSNTPDFILAQFLHSSLLAFDTAVNTRNDWYRPPLPSREPIGPSSPSNPHPIGDTRTDFDVCNQFNPEGPWAGLNKEASPMTIEMRIQSIHYVDDDTYALYLINTPGGEKTHVSSFSIYLSKEKADTYKAGDLIYLSFQK